MSGDDDVTSETANKRNGGTTSPHKKRGVTAASAPSAPIAAVKPELDDFGLPIRIPQRKASAEDISEDAKEKQIVLEMVEENGESSNNIHVAEHEVHNGDLGKASKTDHQGQGKMQGNGEPPQSGHLKQRAHVENSETSPRQGVLEGNKDGRKSTELVRKDVIASSPEKQHTTSASEWSHQVLAPQAEKEKDAEEEEQWETMPAYAPFDIYNDDGKIIAREQDDSEEETLQYGTLGGAGKGYTRVQLDDDVQSITSMDDNTAYLFKETGTNVADEDDDLRDAMSQMQATKELLTEGQRIAYVGIVRLAMMEMVQQADGLEKTKGTKKMIELMVEALKMWSQKMMVRLYSHMEVESAEQVMIEQLAEHGVVPSDLTPVLMQNARVKNPAADDESISRLSVHSPGSPVSSPRLSVSSPGLNSDGELNPTETMSGVNSGTSNNESPPPYDQHVEREEYPEVKTPSQLPDTKTLDIDIRWTVLCDLFLISIADSLYDSRSRVLLEKVGACLDIPWLEICRFEKRVTDALEMQEAASKENWNEDEHMASRRKMFKNRRLVMMGLATVGGGLVIGLSAGLLAPVIGAGLAAGFTTIGVAGTGGFLAGAGGAAIVTTTGVLTGGTIAVRAADRRTGSVQTFEYRPLHNNKRVNLIVTISGWMNGKVDDVRLPFSTVDPLMGDIYSVYWEPEMLQSMGQTISILATEALTQTLQQVLGSTVLIALMAALQLPIVLTKLAYLIDNPWTVSMARADLAGLILADSLIDRNLGSRPITLVGFSLGSRVIYAALRELAKRSQLGIIQNVYMFGSPVIADKDEFLRCRTVVAGRFVNGYATNDWILGYLFRATGGGIRKVAGLGPLVEVPGIENVNVSEWVPGHMSYRAAMPRLLREVGWTVESDEFTEIEDPDPDNHEKRQRELINEIEEARKQLEAKPEKKRFGFFKRKKLAEKKEWETYDEKTKAGLENSSGGPASKADGILFDVDAIRAEVAEFAGHGIEIKQLESTLPPMKLVLDPALAPLRPTRSSNDDVEPSPAHSSERSVAHYQAAVELPKLARSVAEVPAPKTHVARDLATASPTSLNPTSGIKEDKLPSHFTADVQPPALHSSPSQPSAWSHQHRSETKAQASTPTPISLGHNAWADDYDEFSHEGEMKMTFE